MITKDQLIFCILVVLFIYFLHELIVALKISKSDIIQRYVKQLKITEKNSYFPPKGHLSDIQKKLKLEYNGNLYSRLSIWQAISFAVNSYVTMAETKLGECLPDLDKMSGVEFERFLMRHFQTNGFQVRLTPNSGDQGVDLILSKDGRRIAVQAKRYNPNNRIGNSAIQEVNTGKTYYDCTESWVITTSYFTPHAIRLANKVGVRLIDRNVLMKLLNKKRII